MKLTPRAAGRGGRILRFSLLVSALSVLTPFSASEAASGQTRTCYEVFDKNNGIALDLFVNMLVQPAGRLARDQSVYAMHGRVTAHEDDRAEPAPKSMSLLTGTILVANGDGAQMSMLHNFGRGLAGSGDGFASLDCGSEIDEPTARIWTCRGIVADLASGRVANARDFILRRVKSRKTPQCGEVLIDPN